MTSSHLFVKKLCVQKKQIDSHVADRPNLPSHVCFLTSYILNMLTGQLIFSTRNINSGDNGNTNSLCIDTFWTNGHLTRFGVWTQRYANEKNLAVVPQGGNTGWEAAQGFLKGAMVWVVPLLDGWFHHL